MIYGWALWTVVLYPCQLPRLMVEELILWANLAGLTDAQVAGKSLSGCVHEGISRRD